MPDTTDHTPTVEAPALYGSPTRRIPWWAAESTALGRVSATFELPQQMPAQLAYMEELLGINASDLVAYWVDRGLTSASRRHAAMLDTIDDESRIKGWMPDGSSLLDVAHCTYEGCGRTSADKEKR